MPFTKIGPDKYRSPSGRIFTARQVRLYYTYNGFPKQKQRKRSKVAEVIERRK